jgi:hypothetical protein
MARFLSPVSLARLAIAPTLVAMVALSACGDDDSNSKAASSGSATTPAKAATSAGGSSGTGTDAAYVAAICKAQATFQATVEKIGTENANVTDPAKQAALLQPPVDQLVKDIKAANPPADAKAYHDSVVKAFEDASAALKAKKNPDALNSVSSPGPPPPDVAKRLQTIADTNQDCTTADFRFDQQ